MPNAKKQTRVIQIGIEIPRNERPANKIKFSLLMPTAWPLEAMNASPRTICIVAKVVISALMGGRRWSLRSETQSARPPAGKLPHQRKCCQSYLAPSHIEHR